MARILLIYGSVHGQTRKIAGVLLQEMQAGGHQVELIDSGSLDARAISPQGFDAIMVGAPVYRSSYPRALQSWIRRHRQELSRIPGAFFSVCLGILQKSNPQAQAAERKIAETFFSSTGWRPATWEIFAGALPYTRYGFLTRQMMRLIAARSGGDVDTWRDFEYTDWKQVRRFAQDFLVRFKAQRPDLAA